jgi:ABC-2 type transport system permease protein
MFKAMLIKEFLLVARDKHALAALFIMPAVFILIMSLALKDVLNEEKSMVNFSIIDQDNSTLSEAFTGKLRSNKVMQEISPEEDTQGPQFLIEIPSGYQSESLPLSIEVAPDTSHSLLMIFKAQILTLLMEGKFDEINQLQKDRGLPISDFDFDESELMNIHYAKLERDEKPTSTQQSVPSWIVFSLFFVIIPMSTIFISERKQNTLMRLSTMNISVPVLFVGKIIPYMIINQLQVWLMIAVGIFVVPLFGAAPLTIGGSVFGLMLVSVSLSLSAIGLSILIATLVDSIEQATTIGGIINILLGAIGGVMVPKFVMPEAMQQFANVSPMSWGLEGFLDIFLRRGGVAEVINESIALSLFGVVALLLAAVIFQYKLRTIS